MPLRSIALVSLTAAILTTALFVFTGINPSWARRQKPEVIRWDQATISADVAPGQTVSLTTSFTAIRRLKRIKVVVSGELAAFVTVTPADIDRAKKNASTTLTLTLSIASGTPTGVVTGELQVGKAKRRGPFKAFSKPLALQIRVATTSTSTPTTSPIPASTTTPTNATTTTTRPQGSISSDGTTIIAFSYPAMWQLSAQSSAALLYNPADLNSTGEDQEGLGAEQTPAITLQLLPNPETLDITAFAMAFQNGWYSYYARSVVTDVQGRAAILISDDTAEVPHTPIRAMFVEVPPNVLVVTVDYPEVADEFDRIVRSLTLP